MSRSEKSSHEREYRPRIRASRKYSRRHGKVKARDTGQKHQSSSSYLSEEKPVPTLEEVADRTLNRIRNLGDQIFALPPFYEHFDRWLMNLRDVLSEFESSPTVSIDDQFVKERSQILSKVELDLEERRQKEASLEEAIKSLSDTRILLEQIEEDYTTRTKEIKRRKDDEIKRLSGKVDEAREELHHIDRTKTGILKAISKKSRAQKEVEATQRLESAQRELALAGQYFTEEQEGLRDEYERRKQPITEQIRVQEKEIEDREIDGSLGTRRAACEALVNAVNALLQRSPGAPSAVKTHEQ